MSQGTNGPGPFRTEGKPAPGELVRVHGFLNTWSDELGIEDFVTPASTESWLRRASLWSGRRRLRATDQRRILEFRERLRSCVLNPDQMDRLNDLTSEVSFRIVFTTQGTAELVASGDECDEALGKLTAIISNSMIEGTWSRLKCCALPSCGWAFYDSTRSHTKRWCSMRTCGSRHKARNYYRRNQ